MRSIRLRRILVGLCLVGFGAAVTRSAWLSDDAYLTFRTVDNLLHGYGPTWNVDERVQAYSHPLWMLSLSAASLFTRDIYYASLILSIALSLATVAVLAWRVARTTTAALFGLAVLTLSKAFIDYSTSGLENPLTHLILAVFLLIYFRWEPGTRTLLYLALLTALGIDNRMDTGLLYVPTLIYAAVTTPGSTRQRLRAMAAGMAPLIAWELFSLVYYGFPFPNTAYAKLNLGLISRAALLQNGLDYFLNSLNWDPITLLAMAAGLILPIASRKWRQTPVVAGIGLYCLYVVSIGGDFMSGRFLAAPLLAAVALLVDSHWEALKGWQLAPAAAAVVVGLSSPYSPLRPTFLHQPLRDAHWVSDEKANYWAATGLLRPSRARSIPDHGWAGEGQAARRHNPGVVEKGSVGFYGYYAGPGVHIVDVNALGDPLLARLPPTDPTWSIGHYGRRSPEGYLETLATGENRINDPHLALYYDKLSLVTRGSLFDPHRWGEIWRLNLGAYDRYLEAFAFSRGSRFVQTLEFTNPTDRPYAYAYVWNDGGEVYLLDDASRKGATYAVTWTITSDGVLLGGNYRAKVSSMGPLTDKSTLNIGVFFSASPDLSSYDVFEYRYWFVLKGDRQLDVLRQAIGWHNDDAPGGAWAPADVSDVIQRK